MASTSFIDEIEIEIETKTKEAVKISLGLEIGGLDVEHGRYMAKVFLNADLQRSDGTFGIDAKKAELLVGHTIGTAPAEDSVLGTLKARLTQRFGTGLHVELANETPGARGMRSQKGQMRYEVSLSPLDNAKTTRFTSAVREELENIAKTLAPKVAGRRTF